MLLSDYMFLKENENSVSIIFEITINKIEIHRFVDTLVENHEWNRYIKYIRFGTKTPKLNFIAMWFICPCA